MREWVESECKKSLTSSKHLSQHIPKLLKKETDLQEMILKAVKYIGIIFDATPRQGDFFALIARYIVLDADKKRACAEQQLIHCAALSGSLNQYTQVGEVSGGLQARGMKNNQAVAAMQDGCYTNGASHAMMNRIAAASGEAERFIATCLSHCASNAGMCIITVFTDLLNCLNLTWNHFSFILLRRSSKLCPTRTLLDSCSKSLCSV